MFYYYSQHILVTNHTMSLELRKIKAILASRKISMKRTSKIPKNKNKKVEMMEIDDPVQSEFRKKLNSIAQVIAPIPRRMPETFECVQVSRNSRFDGLILD